MESRLCEHLAIQLTYVADVGIVWKSNRKSYRVTAPLEMSGFRVRHLFLCIHTVFSNAGDVRF